MSEVYFSMDVETDGPIPGPNAMLSFAASAHCLDKEGRWKNPAVYTVNLGLLKGSTPNPDTAAFWTKNKSAYDTTRTNLQAPEVAMPEFRRWITDITLKYGGQGGKSVAVAYPATFDFMFVYWYLMKFGGDSPFSFQALDMKTLGMALLKCDFKEATKRNFPKRWFAPNLKHTHVAKDDAIEQGEMFVRMMVELGIGRRY